MVGNVALTDTPRCSSSRGSRPPATGPSFTGSSFFLCDSVQQVPVVFSAAFLRCLVNNLSLSDRFLHAAAKRCLERIAAFAAAADADAGMAIAIAVALQRHGGIGFDRLTKTCTASGLLEVWLHLEPCRW
jgi:DNA polymerase phi